MGVVVVLHRFIFVCCDCFSLGIWAHEFLLFRCYCTWIKYTAYILLAYSSILQGAAKWSSPLKFFAVFSATVWNFNLKFYRFILWNVLLLIAKWNMILLKNKEVIDFLTWPPTNFSALKMFKLKMLSNFQKPVTRLLLMASQWRFDKQ